MCETRFLFPKIDQKIVAYNSSMHDGDKSDRSLFKNMETQKALKVDRRNL